MGFTVDIKGNASHLDKTIKNVKTSLSAIGSVATTAATSLAGIGVAGGAAMTAFIVSSSKAAADVEDLGIQFEVLTGSAKTAAELMKTFRDEEKKSALNLSDYANAAKTMLAFGTSVDDVTPSLRMLGDVSMGNSERFGSLALAFAQTTAAGRLMGQEVLQFVNAGFNPLEQIARDTGRSMQDLKKDMEDGKISVDMVKKAFISATSEGGRFYKAIDKGSASTNAKLNQLSAAATQLRVAFGTGFNEGLKDALDATNTFLPQLEKQFTIAGTLIGDAISEGVNGNTDKLADVGVLIGDIIIVGMRAAFVTGMNSLGGVLGEGIAQFLEKSPNFKLLPREPFKYAGDAIRGFTSSGTNFREQFRSGVDTMKNNKNMQSLVASVKLPESDFVKNFMAATSAKYAPLTNNVPTNKYDPFSEAYAKKIGDEVKRGAFEAWKTQGGAKFSN